MRCHADGCNKEIPEYGGELLNADGDFACSKACKDRETQEKKLKLVLQKLCQGLKGTKKLF